jgi:hypothetical protein
MFYPVSGIRPEHALSKTYRPVSGAFTVLEDDFLSL